MDGDESMNQQGDQGGQVQNGSGQNGQIPNGPVPLGQPQLGFRPAADPYLTWFSQQQQAYVAEMFRQQQEMLQCQQAAMQQQQQAFMQQQEQVLRNVMTRINVQVPPNPELILDSLANNIKEFRYEPGSNVTFAAWYNRYDELFEKDASRLDDQAKVRLLIRKLGLSEHERYTSYILPRTSKDFTFAETVTKLTSLFGTAESVISRRYRCLQIVKQPLEDYVTYACRINKSCVEFELPKLSEEQFKCLVFVCGLKSEKDAEIRTRLLCRIEERSDITLEQISEECQRLLNIQHDAAMIEEQVAAVQALDAKPRFNRKQFKSGPGGDRTKSGRSGPDVACWLCGGMHYARDCSFKTHECSDCGQVGHKEGYCRSAEKVRKKNVSTKVVLVNACSVEDRRKYVPVVMNQTSVRLQLDTGSDITIISTETWRNIGGPPMSTTSVVAKTATGKPLEIDGEFWCEMVVGGRKSAGLVRVTTQELNLLGTDIIESFGLWSVPLDTICHLVNTSAKTTDVDALKAEFPRLFSGKLGLCVKTKVRLELKQGKSPVFRPKRPVAHAMYQAVDDELDRLERSKIISPVDCSEWAAPIVVVR